MTAYFFKHIVEMELTVSGLDSLNKKLNKLIGDPSLNYKLMAKF